MGQHTLRRDSGISTSTGRAIFTGAAALALLSGGTGMAFAGEADDATDTSASHSDDSGKSDESKKDESKKDDEKPEACELPVSTPVEDEVDAADEDLTDDAVKPLNDASTEAAKPVDEALCPIVTGVLNDVDDGAGPGPDDDHEMIGTSPTGEGS